MRKRLLYALLAAGLVLIALVAFTSTATAEKRSFQVRLADGHVVTVTVDVPPGTPVDEIPLPGELIAELPGPDDVPAAPSVPGAPSNGGGGDNGSPGSPSGGGSDQPHGNNSGSSDSSDDHSPRSHHGQRQDDSGTKRHAHSDDPNAQVQDDGSTGSKKKRHSRHSARWTTRSRRGSTRAVARRMPAPARSHRAPPALRCRTTGRAICAGRP